MAIPLTARSLQVGDTVFGLVPFAWPMSEWNAPLCGANAEYICVKEVRRFCLLHSPTFMAPMTSAGLPRGGTVNDRDASACIRALGRTECVAGLPRSLSATDLK
jgi:hypothetical protein